MCAHPALPPTVSCITPSNEHVTGFIGLSLLPYHWEANPDPLIQKRVITQSTGRCSLVQCIQTVWGHCVWYLRVYRLFAFFNCRIYLFFITMTEFHSPVQTLSELLGMKTIWRATEHFSHQSAFQPFPVFWLVNVTHQNNTEIQTCLMAMQKESIPHFKQLLSML